MTEVMAAEPSVVVRPVQAYVAAELPAGRYVTVTHTGPPDQLVSVTRELLEWAAAQGLTFDRHDSDAGDVWASRLEVLLTNPAEQPDPSQWQTQLLFKLAD
jgi:effector-binding domain-containing protein